METRQSAHPSQRHLAALALGKLAPESRDTVQAHVSTCPACRRFLDETPRETLTALVRQAQVSQKPADPSTRSAQVQRATNPSLAVKPAGLSAAQPLADDSVPPELRSQTKYRIIRCLGRGGMGSVYEAHHERMDRRQALKVINPELLGNPDALLRFEQEVKAVAKLDHPNIARAYDAENFGALQVMVMEYVAGQPLSEFLKKRGRLTVQEACRCVRQACLGLQHAHERGLVHRDLKPQNLMLSQDKGVIKILDFGLAKVVSENKAAHGLTKTNVTMGTYEYTAPEQAWDAASADIRADIYSLGCTLYYLIAGQLPFNYPSDAQILMAHQSETPRPLCEVVPETPQELSDLVDRMLAKKPEDRPQTPAEVARALLPFAKGENVSPLPPGDGQGARAGLFDGTPAPRRVRRRAGAFPALLVAVSKALKRPVVLVGLAAAGAAAVILFAVVMSIQTSHGTVRIELSDPAAKVSVKVDGDAISIDGLKDPIRLTVGDHTLLVESGDFKTVTETFTVEKEKTAILRVTLERNERLAATAPPVTTAGRAPPVAPQDPDSSLDPIMGEFFGTLTRSAVCRSAEAKVIAHENGEYRIVLLSPPRDPGNGETERIELDGIRDNGEVGAAGDWGGRISRDSLSIWSNSGDRAEMKRVERQSPTLGQKPPANAIVLLPFEEGRPTNLDQWDNKAWVCLNDGSVRAGKDQIKTYRDFGSYKLHVEFCMPFMPAERGQRRCSSGVYLQDRCEIQVLDSFGLPEGTGECAAICGKKAPDVNASLPPGKWQTYDIDFTAPQFDAAGERTKGAVVTVLHNDVKVHDSVEVNEVTPGGSGKLAETGPIRLQDHGQDPVWFRNIWLMPVDSPKRPLSEETPNTASATGPPPAIAAQGVSVPGTVTVPQQVAGEGDWTEWKDLFDGKTLNGWRQLKGDNSGAKGIGSVEIANGRLELSHPSGAAVIAATAAVPTTNYEIEVEAMRVSGADFADIYFPVDAGGCDLIIGGYGGKVVGIGAVDGRGANHNETTHLVTFEPNRWYAVRLRVTGDRIQAWLDGKRLVDLARGGRKIGVPGGRDYTLAVWAWASKAAIRSIRIRQLKPAAGTVSAPAVAVPPEGGAAPPRTAQEPKWTKLFNGKDLSGWSVDGGDGRQWRVQRGVIVGESASSKTRAYILSDREYSDFSLRFDFLVPVNDARINGGVALRAVPGEQCPQRGGKPGFDHPIIKLASPAIDPKNITGTAHWLSAASVGAPPAAGPRISIGRWHNCEVTVKGYRCTAKFDGVQCDDLTLDAQSPRPFNFVPGLAREKGKVGFQINTGAIRFQKIEILDLSGDDASVPKSETGAASKFNVGSVWVDDTRSRMLTVTARYGEKFTARFLVGNGNIVRDVTGMIKDGKVSWLAKDVHAVRGREGDDNTGTFRTDDQGDSIDFVWGPGDVVKGSYTLRLRTP